jgi:hypothetical protein
MANGMSKPARNAINYLLGRLHGFTRAVDMDTVTVIALTAGRNIPRMASRCVS